MTTLNNTTMENTEYTIQRLKHELLELDTRIIYNMNMAADDQMEAIDARAYGKNEIARTKHESAVKQFAKVNTLLAKKEQVISMLDFMLNSLDINE